MKAHVLHICSAYESGYGQPFRDLCNPYTEGSDEFDAYAYGKSEAEDRNKDTICNTCGGTGMYKATNCPDCSPVLPPERSCDTCLHSCIDDPICHQKAKSVTEQCGAHARYDAWEPKASNKCIATDCKNGTCPTCVKMSPNVDTKGDE